MAKEVEEASCLQAVVVTCINLGEASADSLLSTSNYSDRLRPTSVDVERRIHLILPHFVGRSCSGNLEQKSSVRN